MIDWLLTHPWAFWLFLALCLGIIEILLLDFAFLLLALAALLTSASSLLIPSFPLQALLFSVLSILLLLTLRPRLLAKLHSSSPQVEMNSAAYLGQLALVLEPVSSNQGLISLDQQPWSARSLDPQALYPTGTTVQVHQIQGATALVSLPDTSKQA